MDYKKDIKYTIRLIENGYSSCNNDDYYLSHAYFITNEDIWKYIKLMNLNNGNLLTVCGSGDQVFYGALEGAKVIDTFDINPLSYYVFELRKASIINLSIDEYNNFFPGGRKPTFNNNYFDINVFDNIKYQMSDDARYFWEILYSIYYGKNLISKFLLLSMNSTGDSFGIDYLYNSNKYNKLKNILKELKYNFYLCDLKNLDNKILSNKNYYDGVNLSNIFGWKSNGFDEDCIMSTIRLLDSLLKENSVSMFFYNYFNMYKTIPMCEKVDIDSNNSVFIYKKSK